MVSPLEERGTVLHPKVVRVERLVFKIVNRLVVMHLLMLAVSILEMDSLIVKTEHRLSVFLSVVTLNQILFVMKTHVYLMWVDAVETATTVVHVNLVMLFHRVTAQV